MAKRPGYGRDKLRRVFSNLREAFTKLDIDAFKEVGEYAKTRIVSKARQGKQAEDGKEKKLEPLSPEYIKYRKRVASMQHGKLFRRMSTDKDHRNHLRSDPDGFRKTVDSISAKYPETDPAFFSPARANNTLTGQFLESVDILKIDQAKGEVVIGPDNSMRKDGKLTNAKLSGFLKKMGRSIFAIDEVARKVLLGKLKRRVRDQIKKNLLRK